LCFAARSLIVELRDPITCSSIFSIESVTVSYSSCNSFIFLPYRLAVWSIVWKNSSKRREKRSCFFSSSLC
jgi:hypothetical protein